MPNKKIQSLTVQGVTYDIVDNTSGYTSNTGTITSVKTTAGAHTTINVSSGAANFNVPTKTSHLTNDSGFLTSYTETDPTVPNWAKAETKPSYTFSEIGSKPTTISGYGITDAYTKTQIDGLVAGVLHYKGTKESVADLPTSDNVTGDVWHITADGSEYAWDGSVWQELGTAVDLSGYATKATTLAGYEISDAKIENGIITLGSNSITPLTSYTETDPVFIASPAYGITAQDIVDWNSKTSNTGTVTQVSTGTGLSGGPITTSGTITLSTAKTSKISSGLGGVQVWKNWESNTTITAPSSIGSFSGTVTVQNESTVSDRYYAVEATYDGHLIVNVPWTNVNSSYLTSETDPVFSASAAASITSTDISNWNAKVSDDKTWNGVTLNKSEAAGNDNYYLTGIADGTTTSTTARLIKATTTPEANRIPKYGVGAYLKSTTPSTDDNSTKVATTEFVKSVIPTVLEPLIGNSSEITAEQVKTALQEGRDICIQTTGSLEGVNLDLRFTSWNSAVDTDYSGQAVNAVVSQTIASYGGVYYLFELVGLISGSWTLLSTTLAQKSDIPIVPTNTSELYNDSGYITESDVEDEIFIATYNSTSYSDILSAYNAGKAVFCKVGDYFAVLNYYGNNTFYFSRMYAGRNSIYILSSSGWSSTYYDFVTTQRTVNNKALSADITLTASDVGALPSSTDVTKWNGISLAKQEVTISGDSYLPTSSTPTGTASVSFTKATATPTADNITKYDANACLNSTTPTAGDNSTKVATTAFVQSVIPTVPTNVSAFTNDAGYITSYTDEKLKVTANTGSGTFYPVLTGATTTAENKKYDTLFTCIRASGTDAIIGIGINGTAKGSLRLYTTDTGKYGIITPGTLTDTRTYTLPDQTGTIALTADIPTVPAWAQASTKPTYTASEVGALPDTVVIPEATTAINDNNYIYNGQTVDSMISGVGIANATNLLTSRNDTYVALRSNSSNPFLGLKCGSNLWYAQASDNYFYFGPTSAKAMRLDQNGNALFVGTVQANGNLTLYTPSGNSPGIIFQRGTLTDNYNDWKIYDKGGYLYFAQRGSGSSDFNDMGYIDTTGVLHFSGSSLTSLNASNLSSGTVPSARLDLSGVTPFKVTLSYNSSTEEYSVDKTYAEIYSAVTANKYVYLYDATNTITTDRQEKIICAVLSCSSPQDYWYEFRTVIDGVNGETTEVFYSIADDGVYVYTGKIPINRGLPPVSSSDNGKVLRVVDGAWSAVSLPSASGVSF